MLTTLLSPEPTHFTVCMWAAMFLLNSLEKGAQQLGQHPWVTSVARILFTLRLVHHG